MKIYITSFNNIRYFKPNMIPISTALGWPWWLYKSDKQKMGTYYVNVNNIMIGISEELFACKDLYEKLEEKCGKDCLYKNKVPHCQFMDTYYNHLKTLDFNSILLNWNRVADDVRKITKFEGDPVIVLLVYEASSCNCAERPCLQKWFKDNDIELKEWNKNLFT